MSMGWGAESSITVVLSSASVLSGHTQQECLCRFNSVSIRLCCRVAIYKRKVCCSQTVAVTVEVQQEVCPHHLDRCRG